MQRPIVVTLDKQTMPRHLSDHLKAGRRSPGVFIVRDGATIPALIEYLELIAYESDASEWENRVEFIG